MTTYIGYTMPRFKIETWYVAQLPGEGGVDWGYSTKRTDARPMSIYWRQRFESDMARVKQIAAFVPL